jgi:hypothetical protein
VPRGGLAQDSRRRNRRPPDRGQAEGRRLGQSPWGQSVPVRERLDLGSMGPADHPSRSERRPPVERFTRRRPHGRAEKARRCARRCIMGHQFVSAPLREARQFATAATYHARSICAAIPTADADRYFAAYERNRRCARVGEYADAEARPSISSLSARIPPNDRIGARCRRPHPRPGLQPRDADRAHPIRRSLEAESCSNCSRPSAANRAS